MTNKLFYTENANEEYIEERNCYIYADVKYTIRNGKRDEFVKKLLEEQILTSSRCEPGNIKYEVSVPVDSVDEVCINELWTNKTEQKRHTQTAHYEKLAELKKIYVEEVKIHSYQVMSEK